LRLTDLPRPAVVLAKLKVVLRPETRRESEKTRPKGRFDSFPLHNEEKPDCTDVPWFGRDFPRRLHHHDGNHYDPHPRAKLDVRKVRRAAGGARTALRGTPSVQKSPGCNSLSASPAGGDDAVML